MSAFTDANSHYRSYAPTGTTTQPTGTQVSVFTKATDATPLETWTPFYSPGVHAGTGALDGLGDQDRLYYNGTLPVNPKTGMPYPSSPSPYLPSVAIDRNNHPASLTYDTSNTYGNVLTSTVSGMVLNTTISRSDTTTYAYDYSTFALGELHTAQASYAAEDVNGVTTSGQKQETTFTYYQPSDKAINGLLESVVSPAPDTVNGASTVTTSYAYSQPVLTGSGYASGGNVTSVTDPGNNTGPITMTYNYTNDPSYNATGGSGSYSQNEAVGEPLTVADELGDTTHFRYDGRGNRTYVIDAQGYVTSYQYNLASQLTAVFYPAIPDDYPATSGSTTGSYEIYTYQYVGGPLTSATLYSEGTAYPPMGATPYRMTTYAYDKEGQTLSETDLTGLLSAATYDARGRASTSADGKGNTTHYCYTKAGSLYQELFPGASISQNAAYDNQDTGTPGTLDTQTYAYDPDQNLTSMEDGRGVTTAYQRVDPESLVTQTGYSGLPGTVTPINSVVYGYDGYGRRVSMDDTAVTGTGTQAGSRKVYTYDDLDELQTATTSFTGGPQSQTLTYSHYNDGSRSAMLTPAGVSDPLLAAGYAYAYDGAHRLTAVNFPWYQSGSSGPAEQDALTYFPNNWLETSTNFQFGTVFAYDQRGFLNSLSNNVAGSGSVSSYGTFSYDAAGNRHGFTATLPQIDGEYTFSHQMTYGYDQRDELTSEDSTATGGNNNNIDLYDETFGYDLAYNRTAFTDATPAGNSSFSYMFGSDNQNNSGGFAYDGSGDPTQYNGSAANTYAYDPEQRLTGISTGFTAHYDGDGMRDYITTGGTTTYFLYDGASPVLEETYSGSTTTIQVANGYADGWRERYGATSLSFNAYAFDPQGTLQAEDNSSNTSYPCRNVYVYDGFGNRLIGQQVSGGSTSAYNKDPVQFGGQYGYYTDLSTTEVNLTRRYYDAPTGHFLNRDPIGYSGGQNRYAS